MMNQPTNPSSTEAELMNITEAYRGQIALQKQDIFSNAKTIEVQAYEIGQNHLKLAELAAFVEEANKKSEIAKEEISSLEERKIAAESELSALLSKVEIAKSEESDLAQRSESTRVDIEKRMRELGEDSDRISEREKKVAADEAEAGSKIRMIREFAKSIS